MNSADISIRKENQGETINFEVESSDESEIDIRPPKRKHSMKRLSSSKPIIKQNNWTPQESVPMTPKASLGSKPLKSSKPFQDDMYQMFTNPDKRKPTEPESEYSGSEHNENDDDGSEQYEDASESASEDDEEDQPADGFATIEDEKQDYLYKFYRMQNKGIPVSKKFNMNSDIHEMRREYHKITRDMEVNASIKFSRRMLMACVTGVEFLNKRYDPFDIKLEGWSETVMENMDDYDNVFERLHDKYASKVSMAPEIELMLTLAGSAFMFHLTNTMFSSMPNINDIAKQNPDIIKNMMKSMSAMSGASLNTDSENASSKTEPNGNSNSQNGSRDMKPPVFDLSGMMRSMQPPLNNNSNNKNTSIVNNDTRMQRSLFETPTIKHPAETNMNSLQSAGVNSLRGSATATLTLNSLKNFQNNSIATIKSPSPSVISDSSSNISSNKNTIDDTKSVDLSESYITSGGTKRKRKNTKLNLTADNTISI